MNNLSHKEISSLDLSIALCAAHSDLTAFLADELLFEQSYNLSRGHDVHDVEEDEDENDEEDEDEDFDEDEDQDEEEDEEYE